MSVHEGIIHHISARQLRGEFLLIFIGHSLEERSQVHSVRERALRDELPYEIDGEDLLCENCRTSGGVSFTETWWPRANRTGT